MKSRSIVAGILLILMLCVLPQPVAAYSTNSSLLSITHADYCDLDGDGFADDVLTKVIVGTHSGLPEFVFCWTTLKLTLPSGTESYTDVWIWGIYSSVEITVEWYDHATESGWYSLHVTMDSMTMLDSFAAEAHMVFDPPDEGPPGTPWVRVMLSSPSCM
ncbi:MAG: hypothetical protein HXY34_08530 [Candidatus Thorarchaeota archaeon]|nr:hypothetical protein [Candidatus Thorarchaeota archaeon]